MKAYEIPVKITKDGKIEITSSFKNILPHEKTIKAIFLVPEKSDEDTDWQELSTKQFFDGYAKSDDIYDRL
ncbi:MAG: hypothetical protein V1874_08590 [Spirochaetota bacterium]